jgi:hypothetical protein
MLRYITVSLISGLLFGIMDGIVNANPLAVELYQVYLPIARISINVAAGITIDLLFGFVMAALFILLYNSLPGKSGLVKGISYGLLVWFFRVAMSAASSWMMFKIHAETLIYGLVAGLAEMVVLGLFYGAALEVKNG